MRLIKGFILAFLGLFVLVTVISLFIPSRVVTVRAVVINASKDSIYAAISNLDEWKKWNPVFDTGVSISQPSSGKGATAAWNTNGKQNTLVIVDEKPDQLNFRLQRQGENAIDNSLTILDIKDKTGYQVEWRSLTTLKWYPWEKFSGMFVDKISGAGYQAALDSLKNYLELKPGS